METTKDQHSRCYSTLKRMDPKNSGMVPVMCRITVIATTQIYAKILNEKVGKDMEKLAENFKGMESSFVSQL